MHLGAASKAAHPWKHRESLASVSSFGGAGTRPHRQDIQDTDNLFRIASARGITMPSDQDTSYEARAFSSDALESISMSNSATGLAMSPHSATSPTSNPHLQPTSILCPSCSSSVVPLNIPDGKLMPAPHGISHYVGSASSFEFANAIRRLVAKVDRPSGSASQHANRANRTSQHASAYSSPRPQALMTTAPTSRQKLRAEFATSMRTSKALEPRDRSHPAAAVAAEDSNSQDSDDPAEVQSPPLHPRPGAARYAWPSSRVRHQPI